MEKISPRSLTLIALLLVTIINAQTTTSLNANIRDVTDLDIGFNRRSDGGGTNWWTDNSFINLMTEMNPDVARYPGGTQANYWDWRTGKFLDNTDKVWNNKEVIKIPGFVSALPSRTKIVYVVNMARPTPATGVSVTASEEILKSQATLDLKIADMIDAIDEFVTQGKTPYAVELGNEYFFGNEESGIYHIVESGGFAYSGWDTNNNQPYESADKKEATVMNAKFYLEQCKDIVAGIKGVYPNMKFALTTTKEEVNAKSRERWNTTIFNELSTNPNYTTLKNDIYAVTQHHYLNDKYGLQIPISDNTTAKIAIAEGIEYPLDKQSDYDLVPNDYKIWYTEFGEVKEIAEETWASALRFAAFNYSWMTLGDKVGQLDWHYISDNNVVRVGAPMTLAPVGMASKLFMKASAEMTDMQGIIFSSNPISVNNVKSLYGFKFKSTEKETLLIINTSDTDFAQVQFNSLFTYSGQPIMTQHHSNTPYVSGVYEGHSNIVSNVENVNDSATISKFSIIVIESQNTTLGTGSLDIKTVSIFPNPFNDQISIQTESQLNSISVYSLSGSLVFNIENISSKTIDLSVLNSGMYLIKIETNKSSEFKKVIKK